MNGEITRQLEKIIQTEYERLETLCRSAIILQHPDYLNRLALIEFENLNSYIPPTVASMLYETSENTLGDRLLKWL